MRRRYYRWIFLLVILVLPWGSCPRAVQAQDERLVLAFYYAWFDANTWALPLSDQPVQSYASADPAVIEHHVLQAQQAGLDALVQAWYGPDAANNQTEPNFRILLDKALAHGLNAAVSVDLGGPFLQNTGAMATALATLREGHAQHPAYLRVGGRPVVFFWRQERYSVETWATLRQQVDPDRTMLWIAEGARPEYLEVFDGLYLYSVAWSENPAGVLTRWGGEVRQWSAAHNTFRYWVATVMPGYDDRVTGRSDAFVRSRAEGSYYQQTWDGARASQADWVVVTSFNEWLEGTQIEPSSTYGDFYLNLTAQLGAGYRSAAAPAPTATASPSPTPLPPSPTATVPPPPTPTPLPPTDTPTPTLTPTVTPTPTATRLYFVTPTDTPVYSAPPTVNLPPAPTVYLYGQKTAEPVPARLQPVEGGRPQRLCSPFLAIILLGLGALLKVKRFW